jgi:hypothetical protein
MQLAYSQSLALVKFVAIFVLGVTGCSVAVNGKALG